MNDFVTEITDQNFQETVLDSDKPVLIDFWAAWCGPCRIIAPTIDALAEKYHEDAVIGKLDVDENPQVASSYGVMSIPTLLLFKDGKVQKQIVGVQPGAVLSEILDQYIEAKSV